MASPAARPCPMGLQSRAVECYLPYTALPGPTAIHLPQYHTIIDQDHPSPHGCSAEITLVERLSNDKS